MIFARCSVTEEQEQRGFGFSKQIKKERQEWHRMSEGGRRKSLSESENAGICPFGASRKKGGDRRDCVLPGSDGRMCCFLCQSQQCLSDG